MGPEEVGFELDKLDYQVTEQGKKDDQARAALLEQAQALRFRLVRVLEEVAAQETERVSRVPKVQEALVRKVEWRVQGYSSKLKAMERNTSVWSSKFSVLGLDGFQLEFFPRGRDSTTQEGFCSLFLWCPAGVKVKYQLRVGEHMAAPDEDEYTASNRMGHGHSNFCHLESQVRPETDDVIVGLKVLDLRFRDSQQGGLTSIVSAPEALTKTEAALLHNREVDRIQWRIRNIRKRVKEVPKGLALCSPRVAAAGVRGILMEFYPNGIQTSTKEGFCGFYLRCPPGTSLVVTLFVGKAQKGPIKTEFEGNAAKGLPEFCNLAEQLVEGEEDLVVGIALKNPSLEAEDGEMQLLLVDGGDVTRLRPTPEATSSSQTPQQQLQ